MATDDNGTEGIHCQVCCLHGTPHWVVRTYLVISYYYSYIEVACITSITSRSIIKGLKAIFTRIGILEVRVTDNGVQFSSAEFSIFSHIWGFDPVRSSPRYPQSNGKAKNAVKTMKWLFKECKDAGQPELLALLDWCNTVTEGIATSPAQRLKGYWSKTLLPIADNPLKPCYNTEDDTPALVRTKQCQQYYYNRVAKSGMHETPHAQEPVLKSWKTASKGGQHSLQARPQTYEPTNELPITMHHKADGVLPTLR